MRLIVEYNNGFDVHDLQHVSTIYFNPKSIKLIFSNGDSITINLELLGVKEIPKEKLEAIVNWISNVKNENVTANLKDILKMHGVDYVQG